MFDCKWAKIFLKQDTYGATEPQAITASYSWYDWRGSNSCLVKLNMTHDKSDRFFLAFFSFFFSAAYVKCSTVLSASLSGLVCLQHGR